MFILFILGVYSILNVKIDNYLTDEVNEKSVMYQDVTFLINILGDKTNTF